MGYRFSKRGKLFPGLWFNQSNSGVSPSPDGKELAVNLKGAKARSTICAQGTGISFRTSHEQERGPRALGWIFLLVVAVLVVGYLVVR
jgi:hypothetical protein